MKPLFRILLLALLVLAARPVAASATEVVDRIVAVVNGEIITLFEINTTLKPFLERFRGRELSLEEKQGIATMRRDLLDKMVDDILIQQEIVKLGLSATDVEVDNAVENFRRKSGLPPEEFEKQLKLEGMTRVEFEDKMRKDILKHRLLGFMVRRKVVVSDEEIKVYFEDHKEIYTEDKTVSLSTILLPSDQDAAPLYARLKKGELSFADAADIYSKGPGVGQGGSLGKLAWADLAPDWRSALEGLKAGDITEPFAFREFTAILRVDDMTSGALKPFESVQGEIRELLFQQQLEQQMNEYRDKLRSEAVIEIKL